MSLLRPNCTITRIFLAGFLSAAPITSFSQAVEFVGPIDANEKIAAKNSNDYFLAHANYLSSRTRIVKINWAALFDETVEEIRISAFPDVVVTAKVEEVSVLREGNQIVWKGRIFYPKSFMDALADSGGSPREIEQFLDQLTPLNVYGEKVVHDARFRAKHTYFSPAAKMVEDRLASQPGEQSAASFDVHASFFLADVSDPSIAPIEIRIVPFDQEPDYHLIMQVDHSKMFTSSESDPARSDQEAQKEQAYKNFLESLGEDPKVSAQRRAEEFSNDRGNLQ